MMVLDASAVLAFLFREPGHEKVAESIGKSYLSSVNLAEVIGRFVRDGHDERQVLQRLSRTWFEVVPFTSEHAAIAAGLLPKTHDLGLSLGDRACLALALAKKLPALTADRAWLEIDLGIEIVACR